MDEQKADPACRRQRLRRFGLVYAVLCSGLSNGAPSPAQMPGEEAGVSLPSAAPRFSIPGGFYDEPTVLALVGDGAQTALYYTLDGSVPSDAAQRYESPIPLDETVAVRTLAITSGQAPSPVLTQTYFVGERHSVPVVSLVASPTDLWDEDTGIYVFGKNAESERPYFGANFWQDWEIPVHIEFFEPDGKLGFSMGAGMKIQGGKSRAAPQKSLALFARRRYGKGRIRYRVFPDLDIDAFEALVLRNSGNDWGFTMMRDALGGRLAGELGVDVQAYRPSVVFLNGAYWGIHNIREKLNEHYLASHYDVQTDEVDLLEIGGQVIHGDALHYRSMIDFMERNDLAAPDRYAQIRTAMDVDNFRD